VTVRNGISASRLTNFVWGSPTSYARCASRVVRANKATELEARGEHAQVSEVETALQEVKPA